MIRDMELVRAVLLHVESVHEGDSPIIMDLKNSAFDDFDPKVVYGHLDILVGAGFIKDHHQRNSLTPIIWGLSWSGREFLDAVRDPEIWRKTKAAGEKVGGWTVSLLADYAKGLLKLQFDSLLNGAAS